METFYLTLSTVASMLIYALVGYGMVRWRKLEEKDIHGFVVMLMYANQFCLMLSTFRKVERSAEIFIRLGITTLFAAAVLLLVFGAGWLALHKRYDHIPHRIYSFALCCGNVGFFGIPLITSLLPHCPEAAVYSAPFSLVLNVFAWSLGASVIVQDKKYISLKRAICNPAIIGVITGLIMTLLNWKLPAMLDESVSTLAKMATPVCLLILGMRLAVAGLKQVVTRWQLYIVCFFKQIAVPLLVLLLLRVLPLDADWEFAMYLLCCCPCASMVLNFAELLHAGEDTAAQQILLSTLLSIITIPLMVLLWQVL